LKVIGNLATSRSTVKGTAGNHRSSANIHKLVADYFDDPEPRVRSTSLQAMVSLSFAVFQNCFVSVDFNNNSLVTAME